MHQKHKIDLIPFRNKNKWGYCDSEKNILIACDYFLTTPFEGHFAKISKHKGKNGLIDKNGIEIIQCVYKDLKLIENRFAIFESINGFGIVNLDNDIISQDNFSSVEYIYNGMFKVKVHGKSGVLDEKGTFLIEPKYSNIYNIADGIAHVKINDNESEGIYINYNGEQVTPPKGWRGQFFKEEFNILINKNGNYIFINRDEDILYESKGHILIDSISDGLAVFRVLDELGYDYLYGYLDKFGNEIISAKFRLALKFNEGFASVEEATKQSRSFKHSIINKKGFVIFRSDDVYNVSHGKNYVCFTENLCRIKHYEKGVGFIDKTGKIAIEPIYNYAFLFSEGVSCASNGKCGGIDYKGNTVIPFKYKLPFSFKNNLARINQKENPDVFGYINKNGTEFWVD